MTAVDEVTFLVPLTPHMLRHSYAMYMLYAGIMLKVLHSLMGHQSISSTEVIRRRSRSMLLPGTRHSSLRLNPVYS